MAQLPGLTTWGLHTRLQQVPDSAGRVRQVSLGLFHGTSLEIGASLNGSEKRKALLLFCPECRDTGFDQIVCCQPTWLFAPSNLINEIWLQDCKIHNVLNSPFGCTLSRCDLGEGFAFDDHTKPALRQKDVLNE